MSGWVQAGDKPVCLERLEVGIHVLRAFLLIDETMEAVTGGIEVVLVDQPDRHLIGFN